MSVLLILVQGTLPGLLAMASVTTAASENEEGDWPCKGHHCGCHTREQCLAHCCCVKVLPTCCHHEPESAPAGSGTYFLNSLACHGGHDTDFGMGGVRPFLLPQAMPMPLPVEVLPASVPQMLGPSQPEPGDIFHPPIAA